MKNLSLLTSLVKDYFTMRQLIIQCLFALFLSSLIPTWAATVANGFAETQVATGLDPTSMAFAPDGRLFVLEKSGRVRIVSNQTLLSAPFLDISSAVDNFNERGLMGIAFDPNFSSNNFLYLYYTAKNPAAHNRVSRFTANGNLVVPGSESVVIDITNLSSAGNHNGGGLGFGGDGKLYISTGENANGSNAQDMTNLLGKVLRLNADGTRPTDNPFYTAGNDVRSAIWCLGLRNPFAMAVQPGTGRIFLDDVGAGSWEEINEAVAGGNYGWPGIEGMRGGQTAPAGYHDPLQTYDHGVGYCICGGAFYNPSAPGSEAFPSVWTGRYFFTDYTGWIKAIDPTSPGTRIDFISNAARPIDVEVAPDGALWYIARAGQGGGSDEDNTSSSNGALYRVRSTVVPVATKLAFAQQPATTGAGSTLSTITVAVQDAGSVTVTSATNQVSLAFGSNPGGGSLAGTTQVSAIAGIATFTNLRIDASGNGYTLTASASGLSGATSATFNVLAQAAAPVVQPSGGTFTGPVWVQLTSATNGASIRYTVDGATPTGSSTLYSAPFQVTATTTVKAISLKSGLTTSTTSTAVLTVTGSTPYGVAFRPIVNGLNVPATVGAAPATLSATNLFADVANLTPSAGIIPYTVNSPLWSDNADKLRWIALPGSGQVGFAATGEWTWPSGTIFIKHFALNTDERNPAVMRRLETRVLVVNPPGGATYGATYRWRTDNTDAELVAADGLDEYIDITTASGTRRQSWHYPSQTQCLQCHTATAGIVLGPKTRQLNGNFAYPGGATDNQLRTWNYLRMFSSDLSESVIPSLMRMVALGDATASVETQVRSYLDANCAGCHRPGGTPAAFDARFDTPLSQQGIIDGAVRDGLGLADPRVVVPQAEARSILYTRMVSPVASVQMPPVARNVVHTTATDQVVAWIRSLPNGSGLQGEYWTNQTGTFTGTPTLTRTDARVDFAWGDGAPASGIGVDHFTVRWTGSITPAFNETYTFTTTSDDGVRLRVNGQLVIDKWVPQGTTAWSGSLALTAGQAVPIVLEYFEDGGGAEAHLAWSSPSTPNEIVPTYRLKPPGSVVPVATTVALSPVSAEAIVGGTLAYTAQVLDQNGALMSPQPSIAWSVSGGGNITASGVFNALTLGGPYTVTAIAGSVSGSTSVTVVPSFAVKVNFQPATSPTVSGYVVDSGLVFAARGNGYTYGWNVDVTETARDRNNPNSPDQIYDTFVHLQKPATPNAQWELEVPNGTYQVNAVSGDPNYLDSVFRIDAETVRLIDGTPTTATRWLTAGSTGKVVAVSDGRLTIRSASGASNNKLNSVEVLRIPTGVN